jgi:hypothetical protein
MDASSDLLCFLCTISSTLPASAGLPISFLPQPLPSHASRRTNTHFRLLSYLRPLTVLSPDHIVPRRPKAKDRTTHRYRPRPAIPSRRGRSKQRPYTRFCFSCETSSASPGARRTTRRQIARDPEGQTAPSRPGGAELRHRATISAASLARDQCHSGGEVDAAIVVQCLTPRSPMHPALLDHDRPDPHTDPKRTLQPPTTHPFHPFNQFNP